jgi:dephospho-CoA kinase
MIIGLCGTSLPGRADVAMALISKGFLYASISTEIDEELSKRKLLHSSENMLKVDEELSVKNGKEIWVSRIVEKTKDKNIIIDGIRHAEEVSFLKKKASFFLIGIYSPTEIRFERALAQYVVNEDHGKNAGLVTSTLETLNILKHIDESIPYPLKSVEAKVDEILKKVKK